VQFNDLGIFLLRLSVAITFLVHGWQKLAMWKMKPSEQMPSNMLGMMRFLSLAEIAGGLALVFGVLTQLAAIGLAVIMLGAIYFKTKTWKKKFSEPGGWEMDLILLAACLVILFSGGGSISIF
ncbi:MAG: DoxX family protein, partial [bacterium]|nr:DoxX family protein [bacterium]